MSLLVTDSCKNFKHSIHKVRVGSIRVNVLVGDSRKNRVPADYIAGPPAGDIRLTSSSSAAAVNVEAQPQRDLTQGELTVKATQSPEPGQGKGQGQGQGSEREVGEGKQSSRVLLNADDGDVFVDVCVKREKLLVECINKVFFALFRYLQYETN